MSVPQVFADGSYVGDCDGIHMLDANGELTRSCICLSSSAVKADTEQLNKLV